jgi:hypothetical protein
LIGPDSVQGVRLPCLDTLTLEDCGCDAAAAASVLACSNPSLRHLNIFGKCLLPRSGDGSAPYDPDDHSGACGLLGLPCAQLLSIHLAGGNIVNLHSIIKRLLDAGVFSRVRSLHFSGPNLGVTIADLTGPAMPELRLLQLPWVLPVNSVSQALAHDAAHDFTNIAAPELQRLTLVLTSGFSISEAESLRAGVKTALSHNGDVPGYVLVRTIPWMTYHHDRYGRF